MSNDLVPVYRVRDEVTGNIIRIALEEAGIPATVQAYHSSVFDGIFTNAEGVWGEVLVAPDDYERAIAVLKEYCEGQEDS